MASGIETGGRESGTGQDTPLGVCPCPAPHAATPAGHGVTLSRPVRLSLNPLMESKAVPTNFSCLTPQVSYRASLLLGILNSPGRPHEQAPLS
jgi:hypothetical protein